MVATHIPDPLPGAIVRLRQHVQAVRGQSLLEMGTGGRTALAWEWALTGTRPSPVTLSLAPGHPPSREHILAEAIAPPEGSTASPGIPTDFCDELAETRRVLAWLAGATDEIPVDDDNRGRLTGARDDYARTDDEIRRVRNDALLGLQAHDTPESATFADATSPWQQDANWINAAWLAGVRDLLDWVLGERPRSPLCRRTVSLPTVYDLTYEDRAAEEVAELGRPGGIPVNPDTYPPPQYGEATQATIRWLRGETTLPPVDQEGRGSYYRRP